MSEVIRNIFTSHQGGYVFVVVCLLFVCLLATWRKNFRTDLHEIFRKGRHRANEQTIKFWPYRDTGKTCLGGGMHYPSASSLDIFCRIYRQFDSRSM